jgi:hypothetical protein
MRESDMSVIRTKIAIVACVLGLAGCGANAGRTAVVAVGVVVVVVVAVVVANAASGGSYTGACAAPDTPIATPSGDRPIASLRKGDLVWSVDRGRIVAVPISVVARTAVGAEHVMVRVKFANGTVIRISPGHPTADGRTLGDLRKGDRLDHQEPAEVTRVTYGEPFTYDILPASDTGAYFAGGALIGSTLWRGDQSSVARVSQ